MYVCALCVCSIHGVCMKRSGPLELQLGIAVRCHIDARKQTYVLCKSSKVSYPLDRLSRLMMLNFNWHLVTQCRITREGVLMRLFRSGWPDGGGGSGKWIVLFALIDVGRSSPLWKTTTHWLWFLDCVGVEKASRMINMHSFLSALVDVM